MPTVKNILSQLPPPVKLYAMELERTGNGYRALGHNTSLCFADVVGATVRCYLDDEEYKITSMFIDAMKARGNLYSFDHMRKNSYLRDIINNKNKRNELTSIQSRRSSFR